MNRRQIAVVASWLLMVFLCSGCKRANKPASVRLSSPSVVILSPKENQEYAGGDAVEISGEIKEEAGNWVPGTTVVKIATDKKFTKIQLSALVAVMKDCGNLYKYKFNKNINIKKCT